MTEAALEGSGVQAAATDAKAAGRRAMLTGAIVPTLIRSRVHAWHPCLWLDAVSRTWRSSRQSTNRITIVTVTADEIYP
jgi:hypothetical protein